ncbi:hypothetical protein LAZ67_20002060 [Cordylochernes scorpioides]|uniref:Uncharacterized protein n=1 Tax=Cordylochernes scorpioides TaxID=51811 RepID=A0ABY6LND7_9ARAC|nr:hypothetical protein LAZ67_20002060 [Cordylochernes scorpioides]
MYIFYRACLFSIHLGEESLWFLKKYVSELPRGRRVKLRGVLWQAAVSRGRTADYRRRQSTSWKILEETREANKAQNQAMQAQNQETREAIQTQNRETREAIQAQNQAHQVQNQETSEALQAQHQGLKEILGLKFKCLKD